ncbi:MAG TPA: hypothetical protein PLZ52_03180, partial [Bacteroidales bacterium]|nr:hypothetical protein [Bacteroidales bacterium]
MKTHLLLSGLVLLFFASSCTTTFNTMVGGEYDDVYMSKSDDNKPTANTDKVSDDKAVYETVYQEEFGTEQATEQPAEQVPTDNYYVTEGNQGTEYYS